MAKKRALISVSDKKGIVPFAKELVELGIEIISTGGTKNVLDEAEILNVSIDEVTNFPEMMDGRVKTLHPKIHGGLLARRDLLDHLTAMEDYEIVPIDLVCVNLYPFKATISNPEVTEAQAIETIDIGGPSMLRSGAKNYQFVTVVVDPLDYDIVLEELKQNGTTTLTTRQRLAAKVFRHTAAYDSLIAKYLTNLVGETATETFTESYDLKQTLRYGENNHQKALFYQDSLPTSFSIASAKQLHGKELSYNNIRDADAAIRISREYEQPAAVVVKHMNPCGIGLGKTIYEAYQYAYEADPVSIFGGIVVLNQEVDKQTAEALHQLFLEMIIAPSFTKEAFEILARKKNLRLMTLDFSKKDLAIANEEVTVLGGLLVQQQDISVDSSNTWNVVTKRQPTQKEKEALEFAFKAVKHVKSNAIVVANSHQTVGIGAGQMNRVGSVKLALEQAGGRILDAVLASDAFFPMGDSVEVAAKYGIKAIIQPGGSIKDQESIDLADKYGIAMVFTNVRHFKH